MKWPFRFFSILLFSLILIKITSNQAGMANAWQRIKSSASNIFSSYDTFSNKAKQVKELTQAGLDFSYSFNPRELAVKLSGAGIASAVQYVLPTTQIVTAWNTTTVATNKLVHKFDSILIPQFNHNNIFKKESARVRQNSELGLEELTTIDLRLKQTQPALANFLELSLQPDQNLRIGFCGSGGGYRAMLSTVGFLVGAERIGLLDTALYMSALSGSTWALGPWTSMNISIDEYKKQLMGKTQNMLKIAGNQILPAPESDQLKSLMYNLELKYLFHAPISSVDLWGGMIANKLFEPAKNRQDLYLSDQRKIITDGKHIFPIYTAVNPDETHPSGKTVYNWFEFTPFEIGSTNLNAFTPTWAFGRKFLNGQTVSYNTTAGPQYGPEQTLGYYLGVFGSAFTINMQEVLSMMEQADNTSEQSYDAMELKVAVLEEIAKNLAGIKDFRKSRVSPAKVFNYTYGLPSSPLKDIKQITLVDAGLAFNLPTPPLLRKERALDVIFILDSSADEGTAGELKKAEKHARDNNLPFPAIDYDLAKSQTLSIFKDQANPNIPTIVYMPLIKDMSLPGIQADRRFDDFDPKKCIEKDYCRTFNFKYEPEEFETLTLLTEINMVDNSDKIKELFKELLTQKYGSASDKS